LVFVKREIKMRSTGVVCGLGLALSMAAGAVAQVNTTEVEPNESKAAATIVANMAPGDTITGNTQGASTTIPGATSADFFRVNTAPTAAGLYRYRLVLTTSGTAGHVGGIMGFTQTAGVVNAADAAVQTSSATTVPARYVQWFGFGRGEQLFFRVTGVAATLGDYVATLERTPVTPGNSGLTLLPGQVVISSIGQTTADTDMWIYDANFNAIPGAGNDDESIAGGGTGATLQSRLVRNLTPGTYYLAISTFNLANNLPSPSDDDFRSGAVLDFPDIVVNSSSATTTDLDVTINGNPVTIVRQGPYDVQFVRFDVAAVLAGTGAASPATVDRGNSTTLTVTVTPALSPPSTGIAVSANLSSLGLGTVAFADDGLNGDAVAGDNIFSYVLAVPSTACPVTYALPFTVTDQQGGSASGNIGLTVNLGPISGSTFDELANGGGDAGELPGSEMSVTGSGPVTSITGTIDPGAEVDLYRINICDPCAFRASTQTLTTWDTQLFLFDANGLGIVSNDDTTPGLQSVLTSQLVANLPAGEYLLAITRFNRDAASAGGAIWATQAGQAAPTGPGASQPLNGWLNTVTLVAGPYGIALQGVCGIESGPTCPQCPADFDGNGEIEPVDIRAFFDAFRGENPCADVDGNNEIEPLDVRAFFAVYRNPALDPECPQ
jgi:hypothetical protein